MKKTRLLLIPMLMLISACADNLTISMNAVHPTDIYRKHRLVYDRSEDVLFVATRFSTGLYGPTLRTEPYSWVEVEGHRLSEGPEAGVYHDRRIEYSTRISNPFVQEHYEITWYRSDGVIVRDRIHLPPAVTIASPRGGDVMRNGFLIEWEGPPMGSSENMQVLRYAPFRRDPLNDLNFFRSAYSADNLYLDWRDLYSPTTVIQLARHLEDAVDCYDSHCLLGDAYNLSEPVHIEVR